MSVVITEDPQEIYNRVHIAALKDELGLLKVQVTMQQLYVAFGAISAKMCSFVGNHHQVGFTGGHPAAVTKLSGRKLYICQLREQLWF